MNDDTAMINLAMNIALPFALAVVVWVVMNIACWAIDAAYWLGGVLSDWIERRMRP